MPLLPAFQVKKAARAAPQLLTPAVPNEQKPQQLPEQPPQQATEQQQQLSPQQRSQQATEQPPSPAAPEASQQAVPQAGSPATGRGAPAPAPVKEELLASEQPSSLGPELTSEIDGEPLGVDSDSNVTADKPDKSKKSNPKKDPAAPKAALTSYMLFCGVERSKVLGDLGNLSPVEVRKELGRRWKELTPEGKAKYEEEAARDRARFSQEMEAHTGVKAEDKPKKTKKVKDKTDKVKVIKEKKRGAEVTVEATDAMTNYFAFLFSHWSSARARHPSACPSTLQAILWTRWTHPGTLEPPEATPAKRRRSQAPSEPPTAARLFMDTVREDVLAANPGMTEEELCRKLTRVWEGLDKEDKEPFIRRSKEGREECNAQGP